MRFGGGRFGRGFAGYWLGLAAWGGGIGCTLVGAGEGILRIQRTSSSVCWRKTCSSPRPWRAVDAPPEPPPPRPPRGPAARPPDAAVRRLGWPLARPSSRPRLRLAWQPPPSAQLSPRQQAPWALGPPARAREQAPAPVRPWVSARARRLRPEETWAGREAVPAGARPRSAARIFRAWEPRVPRARKPGRLNRAPPRRHPRT